MTFLPLVMRLGHRRITVRAPRALRSACVTNASPPHPGGRKPGTSGALAAVHQPLRPLGARGAPLVTRAAPLITLPGTAGGTAR
jgi:hypothetical protein